MGKKLFKFMNREQAEKPRDDRESDGKKASRALKGEEAERFPEPSKKKPSDKPATSGELKRRIDATDEYAAKYTQPSVEMESLAPADDETYLKILSEQTGVPLIDLGKEPRPSTEIIRLLSSEQAKHLQAVPVKELEDGTIVIAIADPANPQVTDDLRLAIDRDIEIVMAPEDEIAERIEQYYGIGDETLEDIIEQEDVVEENQVSQAGSVEVDLTDVDAIANQPPVIKLVNLLLLKAIKERASDIHIEPFPNLIRIRYRVDGVLREIPSPPRHMMMGLVSRIKVMANLDIAEARLPQDGRIKLTIEGREVDLRVATVPTVHGESIVMRVLDKSMMMIGINQIGMTDEILERFTRHLHKPNGIIMCTGPTGCGKTTTLYAALNEIKDPGEKLITVEDPVEYEVDGLLQVNINTNVGLTFAKCLRAILRHDPDKVLVGEIRDMETAQISVQASLTGHLVFSTLHTNSASATVTRLIDMGVEPFLITASVEAIVGQRLVRTICPNCRTPYTPNEEEMHEFGLTQDDLKEQTFYHGEGCNECGHTGYHGRMGLFELLEVDDPLRDLILEQASTDEIQAMALRSGMTTMRQDGWLKICLGLTTFEEVMRETPRGEEAEMAEAQATVEEPEPTAVEGEARPAVEGETQKAIDEKKREAVAQIPHLDEDKMAIESEAAAHAGKGRSESG